MPFDLNKCGYGRCYQNVWDFIAHHDIAILIVIGFCVAFAWVYADVGSK